MLGGGARATYHFSEWVGGDAHITINYSTFEELFAQNPPIEDRIHAQDSEDAITELREKVPDFRRAYDDDGLAPREFENFAPLRRFRKISSAVAMTYSRKSRNGGVLWPGRFF